MGADIAPVQVAFPGDLVSSHILLKSLPPPYSGPVPLLRYLPYILYLVYPWCHCMHTRYLLRARPLFYVYRKMGSFMVSVVGSARRSVWS